MRCGESNEIIVKKNVWSCTAEKKNCLLLIRSEKNCTFKLGVEKKVDYEGKTIAPPPRIKWSAPNLSKLHYQKPGFLYSLYSIPLGSEHNCFQSVLN